LRFILKNNQFFIHHNYINNMTEIKRIQTNKIKLYSEVLELSKRENIINILSLCYNTFSYDYETSVVDWLDNQIIFFLDPYGFNNKYKDKRKIYLEKISKLFIDCEYRNVSLDKIVLYLFTWTNEELKMFFKVNKSNNKEKSVYELGLRKLPQNGGGSSNNYVLKYIESLKKIDNFKKTIILFNYINSLNEEESYYNFIKKNFDIKELYIDNDTPFINIDKLFIYLLNLNIKKLDDIIIYIKNFFIKFSPKNQLLKHKIKDLNIEFSDKEWYYKKYTSKSNISHNFFKLFDGKLVKVYFNTTSENNYIRSITFVLFSSNKMEYSNKNYYYFYMDIYNKINNKFGLKNTKKTKEILTHAKNDIEKYFSI